jgi:hypothetical protein
MDCARRATAGSRARLAGKSRPPRPLGSRPLQTGVDVVGAVDTGRWTGVAGGAQQPLLVVAPVPAERSSVVAHGGPLDENREERGLFDGEPGPGNASVLVVDRRAVDGLHDLGDLQAMDQLERRSGKEGNDPLGDELGGDDHRAADLQLGPADLGGRLGRGSAGRGGKVHCGAERRDHHAWSHERTPFERAGGHFLGPCTLRRSIPRIRKKIQILIFNEQNYTHSTTLC